MSSSPKEAEAVNPGAEYPRMLPTEGSAAIAKITKWGNDVPITDEKIGRSSGASSTVACSRPATTSAARSTVSRRLPWSPR